MNRTLDINGVKYVKQGADFEAQIDKTISLIGSDMLLALNKAGAIIAGGAVLSNFTHQEVKDVDVYFRDRNSMIEAFVELTDDWDSVYLGHTDKSITMKDRDSGAIVQFIYFDFFDNAEAVFEAFDFTVCMAAIELNQGNYELVMHPKFLSDVASRTLHFNPNTAYPYISLIRTRKYEEKGYKIGKGNMLAIAAACARIYIDSWELAKQQLGGVYGYNIELAIEADTPFTQENLHHVLTKIKEVEYSPNFSDYDKLFLELTGMSQSDYREKERQLAKIAEAAKTF